MRGEAESAQGPRSVKPESDWIDSQQAVGLVAALYLRNQMHEDEPTAEVRAKAHEFAKETLLNKLRRGSLQARTLDHFHLPDGVGSGPLSPNDILPTEFWELVAEQRGSRNWITSEFGFIGSLESGRLHLMVVEVQFYLWGLPKAALTGYKSADFERNVHTSAAGRRPKWDWSAAFIHLAAVAHHDRNGLFRSDGTDPTASDIARRLCEYFMANTGDSPADSAARSYGQQFIAELNSLKVQRKRD